MASIEIMIGGALVNANDAGEERKRHDKAVEQLQAAQTAWSRKRAERLDFINEDLRRQGACCADLSQCR